MSPVRAARLLALGGLLLPWIFAGCRDEAASRPRPPRNVLLIVVDTLGAEHVGFPDAKHGHTPELDRLAREATVFSRAYSPAPWTQPAVASLFTGVMPHRHGVTNPQRRLREDELTLAERLAQRGQRTAAVISHALIDAQRGFAQGFEHFDDSAVGDEWTLSAAPVSDAAVAWLEQNGDQPFFLFLHYFDPHYAYLHHPAFDRSSGYSGPLREVKDIWALRRRRATMTPEDIEHLVDLYHEEIAYTDHHIGRVLEHLRRSGRWDDTAIVVAADHGEEFMRHGWIGHTRTLYEELLHVPLIVRLGGQESPRVVDEPVSLVDLMPTLLALWPDFAAEPRWDGESLLPWLRGETTSSRQREIFAEVSYRFGLPPHDTKTAFKTSLIAGEWKLIHDLPSDAFELYHLATDAAELHDRGADEPEVLARLRGRLLPWETSRDERGPAAVVPIGIAPRPEDIERLRRLGYVE